MCVSLMVSIHQEPKLPFNVLLFLKYHLEKEKVTE